ncbi:TPA: ABC transporter permease [Streptococcus suis]
MKQIFQERRRIFLQSCARYLRYVFNDHFILVLMVLLGFITLQYRNLLENFPNQHLPIYVALSLISILLLLSGRIANYMEEADQVFLLPQETKVWSWLQASRYRAFIFWSIVQGIGQVFLLPIYLRLGVSIPVFVGGIAGLTTLKYILFDRQLVLWKKGGNLDWNRAIKDEQRRKQSILQFFALFTHVKGVTNSVKPRRYMDGLLGISSRGSKNVWFYLFARAFVRSGDYFGLFIRLSILSLLTLFWVKLAWLAVGLALVFHYLLLFQLFALIHVYDYQYLTNVYPIDSTLKRVGFKQFVSFLMNVFLLVEIIVAWLRFGNDQVLAVLLLGGLFLNTIYLTLKAKKLID